MNEFDFPELYDAANGWNADDDFYMSVASATDGPVLDLGCGSGRLAIAMAAQGLDVVGVDRSAAMLRHARTKPGADAVRWTRGDIRTFAFDQEFALIVMTSHVWQFLLTPDDQRACLRRIHGHLGPEGTFGFETRSRPLGPEYQERHTKHFEDVLGRPWSVEVSSRFDSDTSVDDAELTYRHIETDETTTVHTLLRCTPIDELGERLTDAGLEVRERYGDWDRSLFAADSPEIITLARRA